MDSLPSPGAEWLHLDVKWHCNWRGARLWVELRRDYRQGTACPNAQKDITPCRCTILPSGLTAPHGYLPLLSVSNHFLKPPKLMPSATSPGEFHNLITPCVQFFYVFDLLPIRFSPSILGFLGVWKEFRYLHSFHTLSLYNSGW